jgi:gluconate 2-dehydrogenase gamma chain
VVRFIDQALATFAAADLPLVRQGVVELDREAHKRDPGVTAYARLDQVRQADILRALDDAKSVFFETIRIATIQGLFANPEYGGNRDKTGWKLIGFEDRFVWQAPFGDYDR